MSKTYCYFTMHPSTGGYLIQIHGWPPIDVQMSVQMASTRKVELVSQEVPKGRCHCSLLKFFL